MNISKNDLVPLLPYIFPGENCNQYEFLMFFFLMKKQQKVTKPDTNSPKVLL